ncbi:Hypothetical predicted protein, partial [Olea europaea subsp. europaea]
MDFEHLVPETVTIRKLVLVRGTVMTRKFPEQEWEMLSKTQLLPLAEWRRGT